MNVTITTYKEGAEPEIVHLIDTQEEHIILSFGDVLDVETESLEVDSSLLERPLSGNVAIVLWRDSITIFPEYVSEYLGAPE